MKSLSILLIVITSIFTFIGLLFSKLYEKYIVNNIVVQCLLWLIFTGLTLKVFYYVIKFLFSDFLTYIGTHFKVTFTLEPSISFSVFSIILIYFFFLQIKREIERKL